MSYVGSFQSAKVALHTGGLAVESADRRYGARIVTAKDGAGIAGKKHPDPFRDPPSEGVQSGVGDQTLVLVRIREALDFEKAGGRVWR
jgi:hypothetical protein